MPSTHSAFQTQRLEAGGEFREASLHPRAPAFELEAATCVMELRREGFQAALIEQLPADGVLCTCSWRSRLC